MVLVSLAKLDKYYVVDGKMLGLDKKNGFQIILGNQIWMEHPITWVVPMN
jgi:hypothetical protein